MGALQHVAIISIADLPDDPLLQSFNRDIDKTPWTSSSRIGIITYGLLPLTVTLALKLWPFAIYSIPAFTDYAYDKGACSEPTSQLTERSRSLP